MVLLHSSAVGDTDLLQVHVLHISFEIRVTLTLLDCVAHSLAAETTHIVALAIIIIVFVIAITTAILIVLVDMLLEFTGRLVDVLLATAPPHRATPRTHMGATRPVKIGLLGVFLAADLTYFGVLLNSSHPNSLGLINQYNGLKLE